MPAQWYKVLNDLRDNLTRTILIVLSIAVGLFAVGTIASARAILSSEMAHSYAAIHPSSGVVRTIQPFTQDFINSVRRMAGVAEADARRALDMRVQTHSGEWKNIRIFAVANYNQLSVNRIFPGDGAWPPPSHHILIESGAMQVLGVHIGDNLIIETTGQKLRSLPIAGTAHDLAQLPPQIRKNAYGYISFDTLDWLGEVEGYNELDVITSNPTDKTYTQQVINAIKDKAEKSGYTIPLTLTLDPGQLPLNDVLQAILLLMGFLGGLALFLSVFLIVNTITALLAQQLRQIGVMKAIGARTPQVMQMYLGLVWLYGCMALLIAAPLAIIGARALSQFMADLFNFDISHSPVQVQTLVLQVVVGLLVPTLAALAPLVSGLKISVAQAMSGFGASLESFGHGWIDRRLAGSNLWFTRQVLRRPVLLALRNTFRRKARLALTLLTLTVGGAIFISVFIVRAGVFLTLDQMLQGYSFDVMITFQHPHRLDEVKPEAMQVPGVVTTDTWLQIPTRLVHPDGSEGNNTYLFGVTPGSELMPGSAILQGRWLTPGDQNALVVTS